MAKTKAQLDADIAAALAKRGGHGKTGTRTESGRCSECGASGFVYNNGFEKSASGVRGYRCMSCGTIKPERGAAKVGRAHATIKKDDRDWDSFIDGAAFAFWASPYISEVENLAEESREAYKALSPGPGGRWESVMPDPPAAAKAVAKKFTKAVREKLTDAELDDIFSKFSAESAGYKGAMQSQGEGVGWYDEGARARPPEGFNDDPKVTNAVSGVKLPKR